jgi:L-threonylcarbamoyladenylate synthase
MPFNEVDHNDIEKAASILHGGGIVAFPTETGYGLGAAIVLHGKDSYNMEGLERIYRIKHRPSHKPLLVLIDTITMLAHLTLEVDQNAMSLADAFWPGPLTILLKAKESLPQPLCGNTGKIGVRISSNPWATALVKAAGTPVTATSANLSGKEMAYSADEVRKQLKSPAPDMILDGGKIEPGPPSTIIDATTAPFTIVRKGATDISEIERFVAVTYKET